MRGKEGEGGEEEEVRSYLLAAFFFCIEVLAIAKRAPLLGIFFFFLTKWNGMGSDHAPFQVMYAHYARGVCAGEVLIFC